MDERAKPTPTPTSSNAVRIRCSACNYTLMEIAIAFAVKLDSKVWIKLKCKGCRAFNLVIFENDKLNVSVAQ